MSEVTSVIGVHEVPSAVRSLAALDEADYVDYFTIATDRAPQRSAERWARAILEETPLARRNARRLWRLIGLRLGPPQSYDHVQGWTIGERGDGWVRLETGSWYMTARAVCLVDETHVSLSLSLRYDQRLAAAAVWSVVAGPHQRAVPAMLHQAVRLDQPADGRPVAG